MNADCGRSQHRAARKCSQRVFDRRRCGRKRPTLHDTHKCVSLSKAESVHNLLFREHDAKIFCCPVAPISCSSYMFCIRCWDGWLSGHEKCCCSCVRTRGVSKSHVQVTSYCGENQACQLESYEILMIYPSFHI